MMKKIISLSLLVLLFCFLTPVFTANAGQAPVGACCVEGQCSDTFFQAECEAVPGGEYQGDDTVCDDIICPQPPIGGCCVEGFCFDTFFQAECEAVPGGEYQGDDTICANITCLPTGGCCVEGDCFDTFFQAECEAVPGGTYQGDDSVCSPGLCDFIPPEVACIETVNPHGQRTPPAGSTTLPGPKGGQNEDGFYQLSAIDNVDPNPEIFVLDNGSGTVFGPFCNGCNIKYTEDPDATPTSKKMGSSNGQADAIAAHIIGNGDPSIVAVDFAGNQSSTTCLVPPPPK